jgi:putative zinc finger protein
LICEETSVDEKRSDLRAALRELAAEEAAEIGPHVGLKRLSAYRRGHLPAAEREALQEHLSLCPKCAERLLELRDFEAASAGGGAAGPESLRQDAWESLARRLPWQVPAVRPIPGMDRPPVPRQQRLRYFIYGAAAALLLASIGLSVWVFQHERQRAARLEQRLMQQQETLTAARRSLAEAERQLAAARENRSDQPARVAELEARIAELTAALEELRRSQQTPRGPDQIAVASRPIEVSVTPRFALRGQEPPGGVLQGDGAVNSVQMKGNRFTVALSLADRSVYEHYRLELLDRAGDVLWAARRPGRSLLGDAGTTVSVSGLDAGRYRLRIDGLRANGSDLLAEYLLQVESPK